MAFRLNFQLGRSSALLIASNALAMGSSFILYLRIGSTSPLKDFAHFTAFVALSTLGQQLADLNSSQLALREAAKEASFAGEYFRWLIRSRVKRLLIVAPIVAALVFFLGGSSAPSFESVFLMLGLTYYSSAIVLMQARGEFLSVFIIQGLNSLGFLGALYYFLFVPRVDFDLAAAVYTLAFLPCLVAAASLLTKELRGRRPVKPQSKDQNHFSSTLIFTLVSLNLLPLAFGFLAPEIGGAYTIYTQPAMVFIPISYALTSTLMPYFSSLPTENARPSWASLKVATIFPILGIILSLPAFEVLRRIYLNIDLELTPIMLTFVAGSMGMYIAVLSSYQTANNQMSEVRKWALFQSISVCVACILCLSSGNFLPALLVDVIFRILRVLDFFRAQTPRVSREQLKLR